LKNESESCKALGKLQVGESYTEKGKTSTTILLNLWSNNSKYHDSNEYDKKIASGYALSL